MNIKTFIIHLERASDRKPRVQNLLTLAPTPAEVIDAVDGQQLQDFQVAKYYQRKIFSPQYPFSLSRGEIACFLSHRKAWQAIIDQNLDAALILEDDVLIDKDKFAQSWKLACEFLRPRDFIRFPFQTRERPYLTIARVGNSSLSTPKNTGLGAQAQLVGKHAAAALLKATKKFDRPVDTLLQMTWVTNVTPQYITPSGISETSAAAGGSLIQKKRTINLQKLHAEIARPLYRIRLAHMVRLKRSGSKWPY